MARRMIATEIWAKPWFTELTPAEKLAWFYVSHNCDNIGLWTPNYRLAEFIIGQQLDWAKFAEKCNGNIEIQPDGKWWLVDYCKFQHKDMTPESDGVTNSHAVKAYIRDLKEAGLWPKYCEYYYSNDAHSMPIECPSNAHSMGPMLGKGIGKGKEEEKTIKIGAHFTITASQWSRFLEDYTEPDLRDMIDRMNDWIDAKHGGKTPYKDYAAALRTWIKKANLMPRLKATPSPLEQARREAH